MLALAPLQRVDWPEPSVWLSDSEQQRLAGLARAPRRRAFVAGRWLARRLFAERLGGPPAALRLELDARGRGLPCQGLGLSISHSGDWLAAAIGDGDGFGIDLEQPRPARDWAGMAALIGLPAGSELDFYRHWVLCEAWLKAQATPWSLADLRPMRWLPQAGGEGWCGEAEGLVLGVVGAGAPRWSAVGSPERWRDAGRWRACHTP